MFKSAKRRYSGIVTADVISVESGMNNHNCRHLVRWLYGKHWKKTVRKPWSKRKKKKRMENKRNGTETLMWRFIQSQHSRHTEFFQNLKDGLPASGNHLTVLFLSRLYLLCGTLTYPCKMEHPCIGDDWTIEQQPCGMRAVEKSSRGNVRQNGQTNPKRVIKKKRTIEQLNEKWRKKYQRN